MSTLLILAFTVTLIAVETFKLEEVITTVTPIETKYAFNSLADCQTKLAELGTSGLQCVGD